MIPSVAELRFRSSATLLPYAAEGGTCRKSGLGWQHRLLDRRIWVVVCLFCGSVALLSIVNGTWNSSETAGKYPTAHAHLVAAPAGDLVPQLPLDPGQQLFLSLYYASTTQIVCLYLPPCHQTLWALSPNRPASTLHQAAKSAA